MASQVPAKKGLAFNLAFTLYKNDGTIIANPGTYTKKIWKDGGAIADIAGSVTETDTTYGQCVVQLSTGEMNADYVQVMIKDDTSGCVPFTAVIYTSARLLDDLAFPATSGRSMVVDAAGLVDANTVKVGPTGSGTAQTAGDIIGDTNDIQSRLPAALTAGGKIKASTDEWNATAVSAPATAGIPEVNIKNIANAAVSTTTAQVGTNVVQVSGTAGAADNLESAFDDTAGAKKWTGIIDQGTAQAATGTTLQLRAAAAFADSELIGSWVLITGGTTGVGQVREITAYTGATDTATVAAWTTTPTGTITYQVLPASSIKSVTGAVGSVTGAVGSVTGAVGSVTGAVGSVTGNVGGNVVGSVGSVTGAVGSVTGAVGSVTGNVGGNVVGSVASVTAGVTVTTNNDKTGYGLSAAAVQAIWDALTSALTTVGSIGKKLADWTVGTIDTYTGNTKQTGDAYARLGAPAGASVSADIAAVKAETATIQSDTNDIQATLAAGVAVGTGGIDAGGLTAGAIAEIVDGVLDEVVEGTTTLRESQRLQNGAAAGKLSGAATTTVTIRNLGDTLDRITATVDADGNRTAVSRNVS